MNKKALINRWNTEDGQVLFARIIRCINKGKSFNNVEGLEKYAGRWDLRGAKLSVLKSEQKIEASGHSVVFKTGTLNMKNRVIESVDFSFADISYSLWEKCEVSNCLFDETVAKEIDIVACDFRHCVFRKTNFAYSFINNNILSNSGSFRSITFENVNFFESSFGFPIVSDCIFKNCNLDATNFNGARMQNCRFIGEVNSCWFRGHAKWSRQTLIELFIKLDLKKFPNKMENVDFSEAKLIDVCFLDGIDLSKCIFPKSDDYIIIKDLRATMLEARRVIESEWTGEDKRKGLIYIDELYYDKKKQSQQMDVIDTFAKSMREPIFENKFFELIRKFNE